MRDRDRREGGGRREAGSSLIEVLIALFILLILTLGILQMFSVAHYMNLGSAARTQMTYKCEQVTENVRFGMALITAGGAAPIPSGIVKAAGTYDLPYETGDAGYAYWGPAGANVVEGPGMPYRLSYSLQDDSIDPVRFWYVTVTALPADPAVTANATRYVGMGITGKRVTYVSRISK